MLINSTKRQNVTYSHQTAHTLTLVNSMFSHKNPDSCRYTVSVNSTFVGHFCCTMYIVRGPSKAQSKPPPPPNEWLMYGSNIKTLTHAHTS